MPPASWYADWLRREWPALSASSKEEDGSKPPIVLLLTDDDDDDPDDGEALLLKAAPTAGRGSIRPALAEFGPLSLPAACARGGDPGAYGALLAALGTLR